MSYICQRCNYEFSTKGNLIKHLEKTKQCIPIDDLHNYSTKELLTQASVRKRKIVLNEQTFDCKKCKQKFNTQSIRKRHEMKCSVGLSDNNKFNQINNSNIGSNNTNSTITNNINNQPITIHINAIGTENKSYLNEELIKNIFLQRFDGLLEAFRQKHLNDSLPENNNIRKQIHKDKFIESFDGEKWNIRTLETALNECFKNMGFEIFEFLKANKDINFNEMTETKQNEITNSFMHYIGKPLNWNLLAETDIMKDYRDIYNHIDPTSEIKKRKIIYQLASENVYQYTKEKKCSKECPF